MITGTFNDKNQLLTYRDNAGGKMRVSGTVDKDAKVTITEANGQSVAVEATQKKAGSFAALVNAAAGTGTFTVKVEDFRNPANTTLQQFTYTFGGLFNFTRTYDANGNLTNAGERLYKWDALNRLIEIEYLSGSVTGEKTQFEYDGLSRRVRLVERAADDSILEDRRFFWAGAAIAEERDASQNVLKRFYASGVQVPGATATNDQKLFYTKDHLGSIRELIDPTGTVRARYDYDPYGKRSPNQITTNALDADFAYTGHFYLPKADLYLTYFRAYNPNTGRWLSRDPISEDGGINLYGYVENEPLANIDSLGLDHINLHDKGSNTARIVDAAGKPKDEFWVGAHGNPGKVKDENTGKFLTPKELADLIRNHPDYDPSKPVRLFACSTGKGANSFAQQLADELGNEVLAPTEALSRIGALKIFDDEDWYYGSWVQNGGEWETFTPKPKP